MESELELEKGLQRWLVNTSQWDPSPDDFSIAMSVLPQHKHSSVTRFIKMEDRKRALVSQLLQYALIHQVLGIPLDEITINRTAEGKPYLKPIFAGHTGGSANTFLLLANVDESHKEMVRFPNFNFNVSHHGDYVAIASEPICVVGLDVMSSYIPGKETVPEFIQSFMSYFSTSEWERITNAGSDDDVLDEFFRYWCLKEAFVKALGTGVGYKLDCMEFRVNDWTDIYVKVDGNPLEDWRFWLYELKGRHWAALARGHPRIATESYKKTLKQTQIGKDLYRIGFHLPNPSFVTHTVEELVSLFPPKSFSDHFHM